MQTLEQIQEKIRFIFENTKYAFEPKELYNPIDYAMQQGGKRIRPLLTLLSCDMFGGDIDNASHSAIGIEIFHNFTLLHDDIMDNSPLRRGKATVFKKWNVNTAILSGDAMFAMAYQYFIENASCNTLEILKLFTKTTLEIMEGQQYDMNFENKPNTGIPEYLEMIRLKTAVLLACSLGIGALAANASQNDVSHIYDFGIALGMAFQLQDDFLDSFGNTETLGKQTGTDIVDNKKTFLYLKALEMADEQDRNSLEMYFSGKDFDSAEKIRAIKEIYHQLHIKDETLKQIRLYHQEALIHLNTISIEEVRKTEIRKFADGLLGREF